LAGILAAIALLAHAQSSSGSSTLKGIVRDSQSRPVAGATVTLQTKAGNPPKAESDKQGRYEIDRLPAGEYLVRAELPGVGIAKITCSISPNTSKQLDLQLQPGAESNSLEFADEPKFTVAGVTDASSAGSHGSSATAPTAEALAKATMALGQGSPATVANETTLRQAADRQPERFEADRAAGLAIQSENPQAAIPYLEQAAKLSASKSEQADIHHALGGAYERLNRPFEAAREHQLAAELDPSERNLFDWASELLLHRAVAPSIEVFRHGHRLYPTSSRTLLGLAVALYSQASYQEAAKRLCEASDLTPNDPNPYLFMGQMVTGQAMKSQAISQRLARFQKLQSQNAQANYFYAVSLWQQQAGEREKTESLLKNAVQLDPAYAAAHLELGIVYAESGEIAKAIPAYQKAIELDPKLPEPHYRLALAYKRIGAKAKADEQLRIYNQASRDASLEMDRERRAIQQFVFTLQDRTAPQ